MYLASQRTLISHVVPTVVVAVVYSYPGVGARSTGSSDQKGVPITKIAPSSWNASHRLYMQSMERTY